MMNKNLSLLVTTLAVLWGCDSATESLEVQVETPETSSGVPWPMVGSDPAEQRFSTLDQINSSNVNRLGLAWSHEFDTQRGQEATPVVVDGVLYTSTAWSKVYAFNAATGALLWSFRPRGRGKSRLQSLLRCSEPGRSCRRWQGVCRCTGWTIDRAQCCQRRSTLVNGHRGSEQGLHHHRCASSCEGQRPDRERWSGVRSTGLSVRV